MSGITSWIRVRNLIRFETVSRLCSENKHFTVVYFGRDDLFFECPAALRRGVPPRFDSWGQQTVFLLRAIFKFIPPCIFVIEDRSGQKSWKDLRYSLIFCHHRAPVKLWSYTGCSKTLILIVIVSFLSEITARRYTGLILVSCLEDTARSWLSFDFAIPLYLAAVYYLP
jgi:hypothetical protein